MKLITPFTILRDAVRNKPIQNISCLIDDTQVSINECGVGVNANNGGSNPEFFASECESHPTNSHCKIYDD